jgi:hypothetical protein
VHGHNARRTTPPYVVTSSGCWEWQGYVGEHGYPGTMLGPDGYESAHRVFYKRAKGPIPDGYDIDHLCRNRRCVNPDHLEAVTRTTNIRRSSSTRLSESEAEEIRRRAMRGNHGALAAEFAVSRPLVSMIAEGKRWRA